MAVSGGLERDFFILDGKTLTSGGSLNVTNGVLAIVSEDPKDLTQNGRKVLSSFSGLSKDKAFSFLLGSQDLPVSLNTTNKSYASQAFKLSDILDFRVDAPKTTGLSVDDFVLGYSGKAGTEIVIGERTSTFVDITLSGDSMFNLGYEEGKTTVRLEMHYPYVDADGVCSDCATGVVSMQEIVENAAKKFNATLLLGQTPITEYVDLSVVNSENADLVGTDYKHFTLALTDAGDQSALARVQAQYPTFKVVMSNASDLSSTYTILAPAATSLAAYTSLPLPSKIKGCPTCPAGYSTVAAGFVYSIAIEDDGINLVTTMDDLPGFVTGTAVKIGTSQAGVGTYTAIVTAELTAAQITTFKAISAPTSTAVLDLAGDVAAVCKNTTVTSTSWVAGTDTCTAIVKPFTITVKDDVCGNDVLATLQEEYPSLAIAIDTASLSRTITLTGTSGTANINIGGVDYLATFATDLSTTRANFVTANAAAIATQTGGTLTGTGTTITLVAPSAGYPTITVANVTTNLAGTISTAVGSGAENAGMCQTTYRTEVLTNIVCPDCSDEFRALLEAQAPKNFGLNVWEGEAPVYSITAKMGLRVKGKPFTISGDENYKDEIPFYATSTRLSIAGGQASMIAESWNSQPRPFAVKVFSIASDPESLGGYLWNREDAARLTLDGMDKLKGNNYGKWMWGQETRVSGLKQYVTYTIVTKLPNQYTVQNHSAARVNNNFIVEVGRHEAVEQILTALATASGVPAVQAFAK